MLNPFFCSKANHFSTTNHSKNRVDTRLCVGVEFAIKEFGRLICLMERLSMFSKFDFNITHSSKPTFSRAKLLNVGKALLVEGAIA